MDIPMAFDLDSEPMIMDPFEDFSLYPPPLFPGDMEQDVFGALDYEDNDTSDNTIGSINDSSNSNSNSPFDAFADTYHVELSVSTPLSYETQPSLTFDDADVQVPFSPGNDMPATPLGRIRRRSKLHAYETMHDGDPIAIDDFLASPHMVLALIVRLNVPALVSLSATCRAFHAQYGPLLGMGRSSMRRRFGYSVLTHQAWSLAYEFPYLTARTLSPLLVFKAGKMHPDRAFIQWIVTGVPVESGVDVLALLRSYMCGAASSGRHPQLVRLMTLELLEQCPEQAKRALDWPMANAVHGEPREARTLIDFLVKQMPCDALFVLQLVNQYHFRMTTYATRAVIAHNMEASPQTNADTTLHNSLLTHYVDVLVKQMQVSCTSCNVKRIRFVMDSHHANVVGFVVKQHHVAFMDLILQAVNVTAAQRVKAIETMLDSCMHINGPALARAAIRLKSLRLFETAFDKERCDPTASAIMNDVERLNSVIAITAQPIAVPVQSTPERATKRARTQSTWKKFNEKEYITTVPATCKTANHTPATPAPQTSRVNRHKWNVYVPTTVFQPNQ